MRLRLALPLLLTLAAPVVLPAWAQDDTTAEKLCQVQGSGMTAADVIRVCTQVIEEKVLRASARAQAYVRRGIARRSSDEAGALSDYDAALALDPDNYLALLNRGVIRTAAGRFEDALADFNRAEKAEPRQAPAHLSRGELYIRMKRYDDAIADAHFTPVPVNLAPNFLRLKCRAEAFGGSDLAMAQRTCDQALWLQPDAPALIEAHGVVALKRRRFQVAWEDFNRLVQTQPNVARGWYGRGLAAAGLGRDAEGKADTARATSLNADVAANFAVTGIP